jgi:hypothetical protein
VSSEQKVKVPIGTELPASICYAHSHKHLELGDEVALVAPPLVWSMAARGCISRGSAERSRQSASPVLAPRRTRAAMGGGGAIAGGR